MENYKEKYEQALGRARTFIQRWDGVEINSDLPLQELKEIFPELKESDDEKIRKSLIKSYTNQHSANFPTVDGFTREQILAWLEKQGGRKPADKCIGCNNFKGCITCIDGDQYAHITEQKPTDNLEPKFHEGEWITIKE